MPLKELTEFETVEEAAKFAAGNWKQWRNYAFFGSPKILDPNQTYLVYTQCWAGGSEYPNQEEVDAIAGRVLAAAATEEELQWGRYTADFCGDKNLIQGYWVRVFQDGAITPAFRNLFAIVQDLDLLDALDREMQEPINFHLQKSSEL